MQSGLSVLFLSGKRGSASGYATMDDLTLEAYIHNTISSTPRKTSSFAGRAVSLPMRAGFFAKVAELQQRYRGNKIIANSLQTNGILLNDKWARFCVVMDFWSDYPLMALRHSTTRRTTGCGKPTREKVVQAIRCLQQHDVPVNAMVVVSRQSESRGKVSIAA